MSTERLLQVIRAPHVSEKTVRLQGDANQFVFKVDRGATKAEIKAAVEGLFKVKVDNVRVLNVKGKAKTFRSRQGQRSDWRKAYVKLMPGQSIDFGGEG
jgi:large subunit ribosomal protein L23